MMLQIVIVFRMRQTMGSVQPSSGQTGPGAHVAIGADPDFRLLAARRARLGALVVVPTVVIYFGYILLLVAAPGLMRVRLGQAITIGFPLGLGVMIATFGLVLFYVRRSGGELDRLVQAINARHAP